MNRKLISVLTLGCALSIAAGGLVAEQQKDDDANRAQRFERRLEKMKSQLELSDEQFEKIKAIGAKYNERRSQMKAQLREARSGVRALMQADTLDRERIRAGLERNAKLRVDLGMLRVDQRIEMERVLTPGQKEMLRKKMKERRLKNKDRRERKNKAAARGERS